MASPSPIVTPAVATDAPVIVRLSGVSVRYRVPRERISSFKHYAIRWLQRRVAYESFCALDGVDLEMRHGDAFGLIGPNGAGKSTLLKLIARVLRPSEGRVQVFGRVAPLLELGAGFDMELSGRENVYLYGAILGFRHADLQRRFDRIVEFSGLDRFIDAPLRTYSSGMLARLGFAVATDVQPDILIIDEVLAVGDADFQRKVTERFARYVEHGATILMVSHDLESIGTLCTKAAWLEHGRLRAVGSASDVVNAYREAWAGERPQPVGGP